MKNFKDFGIVSKSDALKGSKISMHKIFNSEIIIEAFKIKEGKYETEKCLHLQLLKNGNQHVAFTGSTVLMDMIQQVEKDNFPFKTIIVKTNDYFEFT